MKLSSENIKGLALAILVIALTNFLTVTHYKGLSRKEKKHMQYQIDSLNKRYQAETILQMANNEKLKMIHEQDSVMLEQSKILFLKDQNLIQAQRRVLNKYKKLNSHDLLEKLDSAYEADSDHFN